MKPYYVIKNGKWTKITPKVTIRNTTNIPDDVIRAVVRFVRPPGITGFKVTVCNSQYDYCGWGHSSGVKLRIGTHVRYPRKLRVYQLGQLKGRWTEPNPLTGRIHQLKGRRYYLGSLVEALIFLAAHELMHVRQGQKGGMRSRVWGARGRYSEIETDSWAIKKLREYRRSV